MEAPLAPFAQQERLHLPLDLHLVGLSLWIIITCWFYFFIGLCCHFFFIRWYNVKLSNEYGINDLVFVQRTEVKLFAKSRPTKCLYECPITIGLHFPLDRDWMVYHRGVFLLDRNGDMLHIFIGNIKDSRTTYELRFVVGCKISQAEFRWSGFAEISINVQNSVVLPSGISNIWIRRGRCSNSRFSRTTGKSQMSRQE